MNIEFGQRLRKIRKEKNLTQEELSINLNRKYNTTINKGMISKWENGKEQPRLEFILNISDYLNIDVAYLMGFKDSLKGSNLFPDDDIDKVINKNIPNFINYLNDVCKELLIFNEKLTDEYFMEISYEISKDISEKIDYDFYMDIINKCIENTEKYKESITISDIHKEIKNIDILYEIKSFIEGKFINTFYDIYSYVYDIETSVFDIFNSEKDSFNIKPIIENIDYVKFIEDMSLEISEIVENEVFHSVLKEILIFFTRQLNVKAKEMVLEYIKFLLNNDIHKESNKMSK
ncbi:transcriptional regulator with XRE-family HTH domain [Sedimentibacter acidaminivorans]|uniref:Transcriptional regulator with XRE-family HTH domain n=1 Tax=Sedimentibacter acidaminivorans TaxID=913099 RepID=A0ABS4GDT1_9FIRM|nr:helix-turn-helix transcriptional regulator [Sedimentibacter acidaminivorans]MBP1925866.1 transcriptional regulator with XRE-family HTH domain [Sedimentibacter acidaminivorans]